jgi:hypothetical protein
MTMNRRAFIGLLFTSAAGLVAVACGSVRRPGAASTPPQASARPTSAITFVARQGADATTVGQRIAGPGAAVRPAYPHRRPRENLPQIVMLRSFVVTVPPGQEQAALQRARADPDVQLAYVGQPRG